MKKNCWEIKQCGREPGGKQVQTMGVCPAAKAKKMDQTHGGLSAGRCCWIVAGTFCGGEMQGKFAQKISNCTKCDFYLRVKQEEGLKFQHSVNLAKKFKDISED